MSAVSAINATSIVHAPPRDGTGISNMDLDGFLKLMIAEMQNQDPLNPMENSEMMQQLSQMRSIGATDKLTGTLDAVLLGQNLTTASSLIGKEISALTDDGVQHRRARRPSHRGRRGKARSATVRIHIGENAVSLQNIREILSGGKQAAKAFGNRSTASHRTSTPVRDTWKGTNMGLSSAMTTALTGLQAAEVQIDVAGNNLANSQTVGFKASDVIFATQFLRTLSAGLATNRHQWRDESCTSGTGRRGGGHHAGFLAGHDRGQFESIGPGHPG